MYSIRSANLGYYVVQIQLDLHLNDKLSLCFFVNPDLETRQNVGPWIRRAPLVIALTVPTCGKPNKLVRVHLSPSYLYLCSHTKTHT